MDVFYTNIFERNQAATKRAVVNIGGARSSKSHSIAQLLLVKLFQEQNKNIGICRKTMPALKMTAMRLFVSLLKDYGLYAKCNHNKSENFIDYKNNRVQFFSLDEPDKIKSTEFNYIWMEEANEFTYDDYITLLTRLSGRTAAQETNHMYLSLNPTEAMGWIPQKVVPTRDTEVIRSTYKDNPFVQKEYIKILENLREQDENYYKIYALGEWGQKQDLIYTRYEFIEAIPEVGDDIFYGLDFGFNNPCALVRVVEKDKKFYVKEELYKSDLTTPELIAELRRIIPESLRTRTIYADAAEPDRIAEIVNADFNIYAAQKDVQAGIDKVRQSVLYLTSDSVNLRNEILSYKWKRDRAGNPLDEPVKFNDHLLDALRYAIFSNEKNKGAGITVI